MYELKITKFEVNENYKEDLEQFSVANRFNDRYCEDDRRAPLKRIETKYLEVIITDKEFETIKKEVLKVI